MQLVYFFEKVKTKYGTLYHFKIYILSALKSCIALCMVIFWEENSKHLREHTLKNSKKWKKSTFGSTF